MEVSEGPCWRVAGPKEAQVQCSIVVQTVGLGVGRVPRETSEGWLGRSQDYRVCGGEGKEEGRRERET